MVNVGFVGGLVVWKRKVTGVAVECWEGCLTAEKQWMIAERLWVTISTEHSKMAVGGIYMRVNSHKTSENYQRNTQLLEQLGDEMLELKQMGYGVMLIGDFNARCGPGNMGFQNYQYVQNNNGELLVEFCKIHKLQCLNSMKWHGRRTDYFTYRRDFGDVFHQSLLDYALVPEADKQKIIDFKVKTY